MKKILSSLVIIFLYGFVFGAIIFAPHFMLKWLVELLGYEYHIIYSVLIWCTILIYFKDR